MRKKFLEKRVHRGFLLLFFAVFLILAIFFGTTIVTIITQNQQVSLQKVFSENKMVELINAQRTKNKIRTLTRNEKLEKAALARLQVIKNTQDFDGKKTGLTKENAAKNLGYQAGFIGDLVYQGSASEDEAISFWMRNKNARETVLQRDLAEIGVAKDYEGGEVIVYLILANRLKTGVISPHAQPEVIWGGPELWEEVGKRRTELGVNPLIKLDDLCFIASRRLGELLEFGKLDGHDGFFKMRDDTQAPWHWLFEKYNISEFLASGFKTPKETVFALEHTLGHKKLLAGGEFVWGCIYAQDTFAVAIIAF